MSLAKILLGTSRSPVLSLMSSMICVGVAGALPSLVGVTFIMALPIAAMVIGALVGLMPSFPRLLPHLRPCTQYRLPILILGAACVWIALALLSPVECPSRALRAFGGTTPMVLGAISGVQCAVALWLDCLRGERVSQRRALVAALHRRERERWARSHGHWIGRNSR